MRGPFRPGRVGREALAEALAASIAGEVTYRPVGVTLGDAALPGYRTDRYEAELGMGKRRFVLADAALRQWVPQRFTGMWVEPADALATEGTTVVLVIRAGPVSVLAACRVVARVQEPRRLGFAYGTLPLHPASGEEAFLVEWGDDDVVRFRVVAVSRPAHPLARLGAPVTRLVQRRATNSYLAALEEAVSMAA